MKTNKLCNTITKEFTKNEINAERSESKTLRKAWIESDNKCQELEKEVAKLKKELEKQNESNK
jgi:hypothetical protein